MTLPLLKTTFTLAQQPTPTPTPTLTLTPTPTPTPTPTVTIPSTPPTQLTTLELVLVIFDVFFILVFVFIIQLLIKKINTISEDTKNKISNLENKIKSIEESFSSQDNSTSETILSISPNEVKQEFERFTRDRIPNVAKSIAGYIKNTLPLIDKDKDKQIYKIRSEIAKQLFPRCRISNLESLRVEIIHQLSKYIAELLNCDIDKLSEYNSILPQQIEELAKISVDIQHKAKCANSYSDFLRETTGTTYDSERHEAVNHDTEKTYAKIAFTIAPAYLIPASSNIKDRVLVPALVYLE